MGLFRFVPTSGQGFRATLSDQAAHASTDHRRREVVGRSAKGQQTKLVATDVTVVVLKDTGHWVLEERPVSGVLQHDDGHVCRNELSLLPFSASPNDFSPPMVSTGMGSLV